MKCPPTGVPPTPCAGVRGCCSNNEIQNIPIDAICTFGDSLDSDLLALMQYQLDGNVVAHNCQFAETSNVAVIVHISLCHFDGHSADNMQLLLTPDVSARVDSLKRQDERV
jgi:hypothetical protein